LLPKQECLVEERHSVVFEIFNGIFLFQTYFHNRNYNAFGETLQMVGEMLLFGEIYENATIGIF